MNDVLIESECTLCIYLCREYRPEYERLRKTLVSIFNYCILRQCILGINFIRTIASALGGSNISFTIHTWCGKSVPEAHNLSFSPGLVEHIFAKMQMFCKIDVDQCSSAK